MCTKPKILCTYPSYTSFYPNNHNLEDIFKFKSFPLKNTFSIYNQRLLESHLLLFKKKTTSILARILQLFP